MIKGLYIASSSMLATQRKLDILTNNLANSNTVGFKRDEGIQESFPEVLISRLENGRTTRLGKLGTGVKLQESYTDFQQGKIKETANKLDLAIAGNGFFVVETPQGPRYTRNGNFSLNQQGQIVTQQGYLVLGKRGYLQTIDGRGIKIDLNGQLYLDNLRGDKFLIVDFPDKNSLKKVGDNLYVGEEGEELSIENYQIKQGYLEETNVNIIQEMIRMIESNRFYEANQKVINNVDNTLDKAVNSIGRI